MGAGPAEVTFEIFNELEDGNKGKGCSDKCLSITVSDQENLVFEKAKQEIFEKIVEHNSIPENTKVKYGNGDEEGQEFDPNFDFSLMYFDEDFEEWTDTSSSWDDISEEKTVKIKLKKGTS